MKRKMKRQATSAPPCATTALVYSGTSARKLKNTVLMATPTLGIIRAEWAAAKYGQPLPCNWQHTTGFISLLPINWLVADAQNVAVQTVIDRDFEWLFLHEDDVILPRNMFLHLNQYMNDAKYPIISGLYYTKAVPPYPHVYRGKGTGHFTNWKLGDKVWVDGVPTGCLLIHSSILKLMYKESEEYTVLKQTLRRVFLTPRTVRYNPTTTCFEFDMGTSDLNWCDRVLEQDVLKRAGWPKVARRKYPFLIDTSIFCMHADLTSGKQYPIGGVPKVNRKK